MKKLIFMLLCAATITTGASANTPAAVTAPVTAIETPFTAFSAADEMQIRTDAFAQEVDDMAAAYAPGGWLRGLLHVIRVFIDWLDDTIPASIAIDNTNDGDSGPGQIGVDMAAWDPAQQQGTGLDLNGNMLVATQEVAVFETENKTVFLMPGNYPLDPNGVGPAQYVIRNKLN